LQKLRFATITEGFVMRIGFCRLFESSWGGGETHATLLSTELVKSGHEPINFNAFTNHPNSQNSAGLFKTVFNFSRKPLIEDFFCDSEIIYNTLRIHHFVTEKKVDLLHFFYSNFIPSSWFFRQIDKIPVVVSLQWVPLNYPSELAHKLWHSNIYPAHQYLEFAFGIRNASKVISPSKYYSDLVYERCGVRPTVIPNPIRLEDYAQLPKELARKELGFDQKDFVILCAGRLETQKGLIYLIEAFASIINENPFTKLVLAGDGPQKDILVNLTRKKHLKNVIFTGHANKRYLNLLLCASDLYVSPSIYETFGISVLEALASGLPIVCTNIMSLPEIVEDGKNGLLVPPGDSIAISEAILKIMLNESMRNQFKQNNREKAKAYSVEVVFPKFIKIYLELLEKK
jgi:glycosyltransferase involved in cell wall biosynthesis